jgi:hypothetical protein
MRTGVPMADWEPDADPFLPCQQPASDRTPIMTSSSSPRRSLPIRSLPIPRVSRRKATPQISGDWQSLVCVPPPTSLANPGLSRNSIQGAANPAPRHCESVQTGEREALTPLARSTGVGPGVRAAGSEWRLARSYIGESYATCHCLDAESVALHSPGSAQRRKPRSATLGRRPSGSLPCKGRTSPAFSQPVRVPGGLAP